MSGQTRYRLPEGAANFVFLGEAGCGKSELAINVALALAGEQDRPVHFFDLDMTKPLFRARDRADLLERAGVSVHYEEQFMDAPTLTGGVRERLQDPACRTVLDVGGDFIGARAVGGYAPLLNRADTAVYFVINPYRPWSNTLERIDRVLGETLGVSHVRLPHLRLAGNPNLGRGTAAQDIVDGAQMLERLVGAYKPIEFFCVPLAMLPQVRQSLPGPVFPLRLSLTYPWDNECI